MLKTFVGFLSNLLIQAVKRNKRVQLAIFFAIIPPVVLIGASGYLRMHRDLTELTLFRRQAVAALAATILKQRFDRLLDIGVFLAYMVKPLNFTELVEAEKTLGAFWAILNEPPPGSLVRLENVMS